MSETKAELEARVAELEKDLADAHELNEAYERDIQSLPQPETDPRRDVAEVARELRGES